MTCTNSCNSFNWKTTSSPLTENQSTNASQFMRNAVNEYGCFKDGNTIAAVDGGMHGGKCLKCLCPYGMSYNPESTNTEITNIIGENCVDVKAPGCKGESIMGQCLDNNQTYNLKNLKQVYNTWFWFPNLSEDYLQSYINMQIMTCHAMAKGGINGKKTTKIPVNGLCLPGLIWPDKNNLTFLTDNFSELGVGNDANRKIFAKWLVTNWLENSNLTSADHTVNPGFLLYISFKDGPWKAIYADAATTKIINPITSKPFGKYQDWKSSSTTPGGGSQWVWGAFIHFMMNYVVQDGSLLPAKFWLHLDKEGSQSNDDGFTEQMYTNAVANFIGPLIQGWKGEPILYLATGVDGGAAMAPKENYTGSSTPTCTSAGLASTSWCNKAPAALNIGVPEWYWGLGNQMPCDGSAGSYEYGRAACTSLSSHRRLAGYPKQFMDLISGTAGTTGSDCKDNGWLGLGGLKGAVGNAAKPTVWPSFSIENLSMCDLTDPYCYNRWQWEKTKDDGTDSKPRSYTGKWGENTTICNSMIWGGLTDDGTTAPVKQGMRQCGVFDGFSHWKWSDYANYLNYFANTYKAPNLITYEASFIPYHWLQDLGITASSEWKTIFSSPTNQKAAMLAPPASSTPDPNSCPYVNIGGGGCKKVSENNPAVAESSFCDSSCKHPCKIIKGKSNCKQDQSCGAGGGWTPGPNHLKSGPLGTLGKHLWLIILLIVLGVLLLSTGAYFLYRYKKKRV